MYNQPMSDEDWKADSDARTLSEAEMIKKDSGRMIKAIAAAKKIAERKAEEDLAMQTIAAGKVAYPNSPDMGG